MNERSGEPVEISTRMRLGEWTRDSLAELVSFYQQKLREMGAADHEIETSVETPDDGGANVKVSWRHEGVRTCADMCQSIVAEAENSRGHGEAIPAGEATEDSKGLGAVFGDADRSAIDEPPTRRAMDALKNQVDPELMATTNDEGKA